MTGCQSRQNIGVCSALASSSRLETRSTSQRKPGREIDDCASGRRPTAVAPTPGTQCAALHFKGQKQITGIRGGFRIAGDILAGGNQAAFHTSFAPAPPFFRAAEIGIVVGSHLAQLQGSGPRNTPYTPKCGARRVERCVASYARCVGALRPSRVFPSATQIGESMTARLRKRYWK